MEMIQEYSGMLVMSCVFMCFQRSAGLSGGSRRAMNCATKRLLDYYEYGQERIETDVDDLRDALETEEAQDVADGSESEQAEVSGWVTLRSMARSVWSLRSSMKSF